MLLFKNAVWYMKLPEFIKSSNIFFAESLMGLLPHRVKEPCRPFLNLSLHYFLGFDYHGFEKYEIKPKNPAHCFISLIFAPV